MFTSGYFQVSRGEHLGRKGRELLMTGLDTSLISDDVVLHRRFHICAIR